MFLSNPIGISKSTRNNVDTGEKNMKKIVLALLFCLLLVASITPLYASITVEALVNDTFHVSFDFSNLNSTMYDEIVGHPEIFNSTSIPRTIVRNLERQNLRKVSWSQIPANSFFNDSEKSIHIEFYLVGEDILSYTLNRTALTRTYNAKTDWIKFDIKLTSTFTLNFTRYFALSISGWQRTDNTFYYNSTASTAPFNALCYFFLPTTATNIKAVGDTLTFEMPTILEDKLIDSPIFILGAIIIANLVAIIYRKVRK
jgi:hypothetical protein